MPLTSGPNANAPHKLTPAERANQVTGDVENAWQSANLPPANTLRTPPPPDGTDLSTLRERTKQLEENTQQIGKTRDAIKAGYDPQTKAFGTTDGWNRDNYKPRAGADLKLYELTLRETLDKRGERDAIVADYATRLPSMNRMDQQIALKEIRRIIDDGHAIDEKAIKDWSFARKADLNLKTAGHIHDRIEADHAWKNELKQHNDSLDGRKADSLRFMEGLTVTVRDQVLDERKARDEKLNELATVAESLPRSQRKTVLDQMERVFKDGQAAEKDAIETWRKARKESVDFETAALTGGRVQADRELKNEWNSLLSDAKAHDNAIRAQIKELTRRK